MKVYELTDRRRKVKIFVSQKGHFAFEKPTKEIEAELILKKLADNTKLSIEAQILEFLRSKYRDDKTFLRKIKAKNEELYSVLNEISEKTSKRRKVIEILNKNPVLTNIIRKIEKLIDEKTYYKRSSAKWVSPKNEVSVTLTPNEADISQSSWYIWSSNGKWKGNDTLLKVVLPYRWYNKVYIKGFAFVEGNLILDIVEKINENSYKVIAGKQGIGFEVYPAEAVITQKDGKWKIKWIKKKV
jgi:hypothetical protein